MKNKKDSKVNGFTIDEKGNIVGSLNIVSYMKVSKSAIVKDKSASSDNDEDDDDEEEDQEKLHEQLVNSEEWEVARTIYSTLQIRGSIEIRKENES